MAELKRDALEPPLDPVTQHYFLQKNIGEVALGPLDPVFTRHL